MLAAQGYAIEQAVSLANGARIIDVYAAVPGGGMVQRRQSGRLWRADRGVLPDQAFAGSVREGV
jgi:hypothetical protein